MNYSTSVFLINNDVIAIKATYEPDGMESTFKTMNKNIQEGDLIVVPSSTRHEVTTCKVTEVDVDVDFDDNKKVEWVINVIDMGEYQKFLAQEKEAIQAIKSAELRQKRESLRDAMFANHMDSLRALPIASLEETKENNE